MWWDLNDPKYIVPNVEPGKGIPEVSSIFAGAVWLGGFDDGGNLKMAAQTYRSAGNDFWPGPLTLVVRKRPEVPYSATAGFDTVAVRVSGMSRGKDGYVAIIGVKDSHWTHLIAAMGRTDLASDARFSSKVARVRHIDETDEIVSAWMRDLTREEVCQALQRHNVPHAPVRDVVEVTHDKHMHERQFLEWIDHPQYGRVAIADSPLRLHGADRLHQLC